MTCVFKKVQTKYKYWSTTIKYSGSDVFYVSLYEPSILIYSAWVHQSPLYNKSLDFLTATSHILSVTASKPIQALTQQQPWLQTITLAMPVLPSYLHIRGLQGYSFLSTPVHTSLYENALTPVFHYCHNIALPKLFLFHVSNSDMPALSARLSLSAKNPSGFKPGLSLKMRQALLQR